MTGMDRPPAYDIHPGNVTDKVIASFTMKTAREKQLLASLVSHLHGFARENRLTHEEWAKAVGFLFRCGEISNEKRDEFMLLSDVLGLSSFVDMTDAPEGATEGSVLGPFYASDSPERPVGADLRPGGEGEPVLVRGRVLDAAGKPISGAMIDMWQTAENGLYATQDEALPDQAFRCKMRCDDAAGFSFVTVMPGPYKVPDDGPVGDLLHAGGRTAWRPAHFHFMILAPGHRALTTEIFFEGDPYLGTDAVFGVRKSLIVAPQEERGQKLVDLTFRLVPAALSDAA
ncbi:6-chlorohydroxyquinol-1,2-dioxygenase [Acidisoma cellulosilytica]|uniref:6-chlorohydroxyquinol-1,2-dioxygenase n=1 Tax=Acidisoma cellulosilyticum TaxID=2802395 RepID=A0A964E512_9PROT|nr:dioxygenase [Acidisoma cellulosilyticum]MCB8881508.1 6-chlorohydroxyquinol-1,2-dioxygenase [Acidisoma cellulosilyticum]